MKKRIWQLTSFILLLFLYLTYKGLYVISQYIKPWQLIQGTPLVQKLLQLASSFYVNAVRVLDIHQKDSISRTALIELSLKNMSIKRARTLITIGGMTIGIAAIVFLVSIGYGLQELVVSRVARLDEMRQTDVTPQTGGKVKITEETIDNLEELPDVEGALPLIAVVGRINFKNSVSDMAVYGVTSEYLRQSAIKPVAGDIFDSNDRSYLPSVDSPQTPTPEVTPETFLEDEEISVIEGNGQEFVVLESENDATLESETKKITMSPLAKREAVVNEAMLAILGIQQSQAVGEVFLASFVMGGDLFENQEEKVESEPAEYTIVGVIPEETVPIFYVPFVDLRSLGIINYSQVKVIAYELSDLAMVREQIEAMGYTTRSVADTVAQINTLFSTVRTVLALVGMVALSVAALGMFNTLTISLLERTREVGLMKAMGMKSSEVQELFLTESMIMGFFGGVLGILLGSLLGKIISLILTIFSLSQQAGVIDISYVPLSFVSVIVILSLLVGLLTGIFPARRATKISALDALRYE